MSFASFRSDKKGAAAVEFAMVAMLLVLCLLFITFVGLILYLNQALDFATSKAARQVMIGYVQTNGVSQSDFRTTILCPYLPATVSCNDVIVNVQTTTEANGYAQFIQANNAGLVIPALSNGSATYSPGGVGDYEYLQVIYPVTFLPSALLKFFGNATYNGSSAYLLVSTAAFRNEQYN